MNKSSKENATLQTAQATSANSARTTETAVTTYRNAQAPTIIVESYNSLAEYEEVHGSIDDLNELVYTYTPLATEKWAICPWLPEYEYNALYNAYLSGQDMEEAMLSLFGRDITCYEIVGGHTGREEDTIYYYCAH